MPGSSETRYALAVRDDDGLFVFMWIKHSVKRSGMSEFFVMLPRPQDRRIDAHASYHADGTYAIKTHVTVQELCGTIVEFSVTGRVDLQVWQ